MTIRSGGNPQLLDGFREFWSGAGEHISESFIRGMADKIRPLSPLTAGQLMNCAEHSNRLAAENAELWERAMSLEEKRYRYFVTNWPIG